MLFVIKFDIGNMDLRIIVIFLIFVSLSLLTISAADNNTNETLMKPSITGNIYVDLKDLFQSIGAIIAIVLGIREFRKKKVSLKIKLAQTKFSSKQYENYGDHYSITEIGIKVDLRNIGLEPTTLIGVNFYSNVELLNSLEMANEVDYTQIGRMTRFNDIRIDPNDRMIIELSVFKDILLPKDLTEIKAKLIFKTTHKDISKKIKLILD